MQTLEITLPAQHLWFEDTQEFFDTEEVTFKLEHSLFSLSKWESKHKKPLLETLEKGNASYEELVDYIRCMNLATDIPDYIYDYLTVDFYNTVMAYINDPMTATTITRRKEDKRKKKQFITAELLYSYMVGFRVPFECQHWHLNRLIILLEVLSIQNDPKGNKMSKRDMLRNNARENARRQAARAKLH